MHSPHATFALGFLSACPHPMTILSSTTQQLKPSMLHIILILPCSHPISELRVFGKQKSMDDESWILQLEWTIPASEL
jgi:hypothetical protein